LQHNNVFRDANVVITGGSRGLGFALTRRMLEAGARVTICGRSTNSLASAASELKSEATNHSLAVAVCDVRSREACDELIREVTARNGPIDILINNAGVIEVGPLVVQTHDDFREAMDTHFWGPPCNAAPSGTEARTAATHFGRSPRDSRQD
jgi:NAD(P)-dependent dehydrogenase (short-subunit alcohol dehydrogenase family)